MITTYHLNTNELTVDFLKAIKSLYKGKTASITVEDEIDETEYLLASETNSNILHESLNQAEKGELITVNIGNTAA